MGESWYYSWDKGLRRDGVWGVLAWEWITPSPSIDYSPFQVFLWLSFLPWGGSGGCWVHFGLSYCFNFGAGSLVPRADNERGKERSGWCPGSRFLPVRLGWGGWESGGVCVKLISIKQLESQK